MANTDIKLKRKLVNFQDVIAGNDLNLRFLYTEENFPLTDQNGEPLLSDKTDGEGNVLPQYYEFEVIIPITGTIPETEAEQTVFIEGIKTQADEQAKQIAQKRANKILEMNSVKSIVSAIGSTEETVFEGTVGQMLSSAKKPRSKKAAN